MIQILIIILLICFLIYALYIGVNKSFTISDYDLNTSGLIRTESQIKEQYSTSELTNSYKNFTHLFWLKIRYPETGRILKHEASTTSTKDKSFIIDFHKDNAVLDISLYDSNTSAPHLHIERSNFPINTWIFVAVVMNGNTLDLYLQNKLVETRETASFLINSSMYWSDIIYGKDALETGTNINFSVGNAFLSAHRFFPYQTQQNEIDRLFKDEYPLYYNSENRYEFNLELAKNGSSTKITI
jgi:hypothetical protein